MPVVLDNDTGERILLYGTDGSTLRALIADSSGRLVVVGIGAGGAVEVVQDTPDDLRVAIYGIDGSTQRQGIVDSAGRFEVVPGWDALARKHYAAGPSTHAATDRWEYVVPSGQFAVVEHAFVMIDATTAVIDGQARIVVRSSGDTDLAILVDIRSRADVAVLWAASPHCILDAGEKLIGRTVSNDTVPRGFILSAIIREYTK